MYSPDQLKSAFAKETERFEAAYRWLEEAMPKRFFEELSTENTMLVAHSLMGWDLQNYFSQITLKHAAIVMTIDDEDADVRILEGFSEHGIKNYQAYVSKIPPPFAGVTNNLRVATIYFTEVIETIDKPFAEEARDHLKLLVKVRHPTFQTKNGGI